MTITNTPKGHKAEKNFLVAVTHKSETFFNTRTANIKSWVKEEFGENIKIGFEPVDLSDLKSTHKNGIDKDGLSKNLFGGVWEFKYVE